MIPNPILTLLASDADIRKYKRKRAIRKYVVSPLVKLVSHASTNLAHALSDKYTLHHLDVSEFDYSQHNGRKIVLRLMPDGTELWMLYFSWNNPDKVWALYDGERDGLAGHTTQIGKAFPWLFKMHNQEADDGEVQH